jgi:hypothetical protein
MWLKIRCTFNLSLVATFTVMDTFLSAYKRKKTTIQVYRTNQGRSYFLITYVCATGFSAVSVMKIQYRSWLIIEKEGRVTNSLIAPRFVKLCTVKQAHPPHWIRHEPLQHITLLVSNIKLFCMLMFHLITNTIPILGDNRKGRTSYKFINSTAIC